MEITFLLNGDAVSLRDVPPTRTVLDWLRESRGLTGTKEGCNEGDCGACTVMVTEADGTQARALNACILFLPQVHGKALHTVEGIAGPDGALHPVQQAMIDHHGTQCGFCTPGFILSMVVAHLNGDTDHATALAGNLCRCTGYAPILRAARTAAELPSPGFFLEKILSGGRLLPPQEAEGGGPTAPLLPRSSDALAALLVARPGATLVAGATDVGLWVTKGLRDPDPVIFLQQCTDLQQIEITESHIRIGAAVTINHVLDAVAPHHPSFAALLRRYGSAQVRAAATLGGNIANGSPIGDGAPALIALDAVLYLRAGDARRQMPLEAFFLDYGRQDLREAEFIEAISIPRQPDRLRCYKISKRFDQDISALCGCFSIAVDAAGRVASARIAFGGLAGIPKRAHHVETALTGQPWSTATIAGVSQHWARDFQPIGDMRASARYRLIAARNLLLRYYLDLQDAPVSVQAVRA